MNIDNIVKLLSALNTGGMQSMTDFNLASEMVNSVNFDWSDPTKKIIDPACGSGMFLLACADKLYEYGHSPKHIITKMLYGQDINEVQVMVARRTLQLWCDVSSNIKQGDSLEEMKHFNLSIGNPPFQSVHEDGNRKDNAQNLWTHFMKWSLEHSDQVAMILPTTWTSPSADAGRGERLWDIFTKYSTYANVTDVAKYFPKVGSTFGYVIIDKTGDDGLTFSDGQSTKLGFLPKSGLDEVLENLSTTDSQTIGGQYRCNQANGNDRRVAIPVTRAVTEQSVQILEDGRNKPKGGSSHTDLWYYIYAGDDCEYVRDRVIECADILNTHCKWSGYLNLKTVKMIRVDQ